jgi:hypothetical protein
MENIKLIRKLPDFFLRAFQIIWKTSRLSGRLPVCLQSLCFCLMVFTKDIDMDIETSSFYFSRLYGNYTINPETFQPLVKTSRISSIWSILFQISIEILVASGRIFWIFQSFQQVFQILSWPGFGRHCFPQSFWTVGNMPGSVATTLLGF